MVLYVPCYYVLVHFLSIPLDQVPNNRNLRLYMSRTQCTISMDLHPSLNGTVIIPPSFDPNLHGSRALITLNFM